MLDQFQDSISRYAAQYSVPESWVKAVIMAESSGNPNSSNPSDPSYGLMGLMPETARGLGYTGTVEGLYDPDTNIHFGSKLLGQLIASYGNDFRRVYSAYNSGNPDLYLTSTQVAANVARAEGFLETGAAVLAVGLVAGAVWWWRKKRKGKL